MNNSKINAIQYYFTPGLMLLLGAVLVFRPDSISALFAKLLGTGLVLLGVLFGAAAVMTKADVLRRTVSSLALVMIGGWLLKNPLRLAAALGRLVGILVVLRGGQDLLSALRLKHGLGYALITAAVGVLLIVMPMTASRLVMSVCGILVLLLGVTMLADRLKYGRRYPSSGEDNIVDAQ